MTKTEIIEETAAFYNNANRSYDKESYMCYYQHPENPEIKCAVGRCMTEEAIEKYGSFVSTLSGLSARNNLDDILQEKYKGHGFDFWEDLQAFHDTNHCWSEDGLTVAGQDEKKRLLEQYSMISSIADVLCGYSCGTSADAIIEYCSRPDISAAQIERIIREISKWVKSSQNSHLPAL